MKIDNNNNNMHIFIFFSFLYVGICLFLRFIVRNVTHIINYLRINPLELVMVYCYCCSIVYQISVQWVACMFVLVLNTISYAHFERGI